MAYVNIIGFRWLSFLPARFRCLVEFQVREFPQQGTRSHLINASSGGAGVLNSPDLF
jgi:hypothetical protein